MFSGLYYILWTLKIAFLMTCVRAGQLSFFWPSSQPWSEVWRTLITGFRFDLMIVGFWMIPVVLISLILKGFKQTPKIQKFYLHFTWFLISFLWFKDLLYFPSIKDRLWLADHQQNLFPNLQEIVLPWWGWVLVVVVFLWILRSGYERIQSFSQKWTSPGWTALLIALLWTALIARGSLGQHHLRRVDCQFSKQSLVESLCLSPVFTFSKKK